MKIRVTQNNDKPEKVIVLSSEYFSKIGRAGGLKRNPKKGFGSMNKEQLQKNAAKALKKRWGK